MQLHKVENHEGLAKDINNGAILLTDKKVADNYLEMKRRANENRALKEKVAAMSEEISSIKQLLTQLLEKNQNK